MSPFLLLGLLLGLLALLFVLYPILRPGPNVAAVSAATSDLEERRQALYRQILEIEFDQQMGKISDSDAREVTAALLREAAALLRRQTATQRDADADIEREIAAVRRAMAAVRPTEVEALG